MEHRIKIQTKLVFFISQSDLVKTIMQTQMILHSTAKKEKNKSSKHEFWEDKRGKVRDINLKPPVHRSRHITRDRCSHLCKSVSSILLKRPEPRERERAAAFNFCDAVFESFLLLFLFRLLAITRGTHIFAQFLSRRWINSTLYSASDRARNTKKSFFVRSIRHISKH